MTEDDLGDLENVTRCPGCNTRQAHEILKEKELKGDSGVDYLLRCEGCGNVHKMIFRSPKAIEVKFTLSDGPTSQPFHMEIDEDEVFTLGDEFEALNMLWRITRIEVPGDENPNHIENKTYFPSEMSFVCHQT